MNLHESVHGVRGDEVVDLESGRLRQVPLDLLPAPPPPADRQRPGACQQHRRRPRHVSRSYFEAELGVLGQLHSFNRNGGVEHQQNLGMPGEVSPVMLKVSVKVSKAQVGIRLEQTLLSRCLRM
jgi:hypothetical protein